MGKIEKSDEQILEQIQRYISKVEVKEETRVWRAYGMRSGEILALSSIEDRVKAVMLAFDFGVAKGNNAARRQT